jgi:hypothetical protein
MGRHSTHAPGALLRKPAPADAEVHSGETSAKRRARRFACVDVALVRWPAEQARRDELHEHGQPRVLLVEDGVAPVALDELEDWIRVPAADGDLRARVEGLRRRAEARREPRPTLDDDGVLRLGGRWVALPPIEARLAGALVARYGAVVARDDLGTSGWPDGAPGRNALDVHVLRLRRRVAPLALRIRTVRSRGYLLELADGAR